MQDAQLRLKSCGSGKKVTANENENFSWNFICNRNCNLPSGDCVGAWGVKEQKGAVGFACRSDRLIRRKDKLAFAAALSDCTASGEAAFLYAGVFIGVLEFSENCGVYFIWADVCGDSCGVGVCQIFFSRAGSAVCDVCNFDDDAV